MSSIEKVLVDFIIQANEGGLKTSKYPKEFLDLKMKVSFGMGMAARVPWISLTGQECLRVTVIFLYISFTRNKIP